MNERTNERTNGRTDGRISAIRQMLTVFGCLRVALFGARSGRDVAAITLSLFVITLTSIVTGACLPLLLDRCGVDPAHASTAIQVRTCLRADASMAASVKSHGWMNECLTY